MRLTIDFETIDEGIQASRGSAWAWKGAHVLGCGLKIDNKPAYYSTDMSEVLELVDKADTIVGHNLSYDAGILHMLGADIKKLSLRCTVIGAKLHENTATSFKLDDLAAWHLQERKSTSDLITAGERVGLYTIQKTYEDPEMYQGGKASVRKRLMTQRKKMLNLVYANLDKLQAESSVVADYCINDVELCAKLDDIWVRSVGAKQYEHYSKLINVSIAMRAKGIRVDTAKAYEVMFALREALRPLERELWDMYGHFNFNSPKQVSEWAHDKLGLKGFIEDPEEGKESFGKGWVEANIDNEAVALFAQVKKLDKLGAFCQTVLDHEINGRVHPQLNPMQARTGRFSCSSPNFQQIPSKDETYAPMLRSIFLPEEGEQWHSLDFSAQEPRLQIHYAEAIGSENGKYLAEKYRADPKTDLYIEACELIKQNSGVIISRTDAKVMTLALSYGMGAVKGARALGVNEREYKRIRNAYFKGASYLKELNQYCQDKIKSKGYLTTLGGRKTYNVGGKEYKALNSLIQGGAFDECCESLINAYYKHNIV
ncbi:MAG: hypothetical protein KAJ19_27280, partial [Gammaproteobacteria bacterium]|nr:hypothetical protein [Gammaproteobacteria bacterium]